MTQTIKLFMENQKLDFVHLIRNITFKYPDSEHKVQGAIY